MNPKAIPPKNKDASPQRYGTTDGQIRTFRGSEEKGRPDLQWAADTIRALMHLPREARANQLRVVRDVLYSEMGSGIEDSEKLRAELAKALSFKSDDKDGKDIWEIRAAAALMLGATFNRDALPALLNRFEKEERIEVRECITAAIGRIGLDDDLVRQFTVNMLLQYHALMWEGDDTRIVYVNAVRAFLYSKSGYTKIALDDGQRGGMVQSLLVPAKDSEGNDNWQLRAASALLLGAGSVWEALPALVKAAAKDESHEVRDVAMLAAVRIANESPRDAKDELGVMLAPGKGETDDIPMAHAAGAVLARIMEPEDVAFGMRLQPSVPVIALIVDPAEKLKGYLRLAKGKGLVTSDHEYFHMIVSNIGLESAIRLVMGGDCVNLTVENIQYVQDVVGKIATAAFKKGGADAYGRVVVALSDITLQRALEMRKAKREAIDLNPSYPMDKTVPPAFSADDEKVLLGHLSYAYRSGDYSILVKTAGVSRPLHALLTSSLLKMDEGTLEPIKRIIFAITVEAVKQKGSDAFHEVSSALVETCIREDSPLFALEADVAVLQFGKEVSKLISVDKRPGRR